MMKKVLLGGLFGGVCFVGGVIVDCYLEIKNGHRLAKDIVSGNKRISDLSYREKTHIYRYFDFAEWKAKRADANGDFMHD